jgi:hypothetical protein
MTEAQVEGFMILETVPVEGTTPETAVLEGVITEPEFLVAPEPTEVVHDDALPEASRDVVVRSLEIQDAKPIRSASMSEAALTSRGGLELLSDDLIESMMVARNLETMHRAE